MPHERKMKHGHSAHVSSFHALPVRDSYSLNLASPILTAYNES